LISLIDQCNLEEKILLIRRLEAETFEIRFKRLLARLRTDELSLPEITQEVEYVRFLNGTKDMQRGDERGGNRLGYC